MHRLLRMSKPARLVLALVLAAVAVMAGPSQAPVAAEGHPSYNLAVPNSCRIPFHMGQWRETDEGLRVCAADCHPVNCIIVGYGRMRVEFDHPNVLLRNAWERIRNVGGASASE